MAIFDTILSTPVDIAGPKTAKTPQDRFVDGAFTNLIDHAKNHGSYAASGSAGGEALLAGHATAAPCGGIGTALRIVLLDGIGVLAGDIEYISTTCAVRNRSMKEAFGTVLMVGPNRKMLVTGDMRTCILYMPNESLAGFQGAWVMFDATGQNIEKALGSRDLKARMAVMGGTSSL